MEAEVMGTNKKHLFLRIPTGGAARKILTLPRAILPRGMGQAHIVEIEIEPGSVRPRDDGPYQIFGGYTADVKVLRVVNYKEEEGQPTSIG